MAIAQRSAETIWTGSLAEGNGTVAGATETFTLPVTWAARTEEPRGLSSPEELAAAAHSSCFAMALSAELGKGGNDPERLHVSAVVTLDRVDGAPTVVSSELTVRGRVPGIDAAGFDTAVQSAAKNCPISRLFAGASITANATLEEG